MRARILWTMGFHPHPRIKSGAGSSLPPSMGKELGALLTFAALIALLGAGCADGGIRGPLSDNDGPEAMDVGNRAFDANLYEAALNAYAIAGESMPERAEPLYNSANALYRQERFREAISMYDELLTGRDLELAGRTTYNAGNALYGAGEHEQAIEMYKQALRYDPNDMDAKHNLELALAHRVEPQPPPEQQQQQQDQQQQQEQQGQQQQDQPQQQQGEQQQDQQQQQEGEPQPGEQDGEPQPGEDNEGEPQGEGEESSPTEPGASDPEAGQDESDWPIIPPSGMTEDQAMQLLESIGENSLPLRNAIEQRRLYSVQPGGQNW